GWECLECSHHGAVSASEALLAAAAFCLVFLLLQRLQQRPAVPEGLRRPPGPRGFPVLGNVLELRKDTHLALARLSRRYGDVMEVRIGSRPVLVLSGLDTIRQALVRQAEDFMGRPDLPSFHYIANGQSMTFSPDSGHVWKALRKLAQSALKSFSIAPSPTSSSTCLLEEHVSKEAEYLVTKFLHRIPGGAVANVILPCASAASRHDDQDLLSLVDIGNDFGEVAGSGHPADFIPVLRYLPSRTMEIFKDLNRRFNAFVQRIVQEHYSSFDKEHIRDITDSLIGHCQEKNVGDDSRGQLSSEKIINIVNDLFGAGFDTVATALSWSLMYVALYPDIQSKIQEELDQRIGRERRPRLSDRGSLPYTEASSWKMQASSYRALTPSLTGRATVLNGYFIPKGTCVFINQWQVNHDEPSAFKPERFLNARTELNRTESDKVLSFAGQAALAIGETIGPLEIFLLPHHAAAAAGASPAAGRRRRPPPVDAPLPSAGHHPRCRAVRVKEGGGRVTAATGTRTGGRA
uniref:Cytochrome P450 1A n=1 Tax=Malurus cyaneus samueli TaxID=2593467 RepID=A0A8C5TYL8_9PASS